MKRIILVLLAISCLVLACDKTPVTPPVNNPPTVTLTAKPLIIKTCPINGCGGDGYQSLLTAVATDPEGQLITYRWSSLPASASFSADEHVPTALFVAFMAGYYQVAVEACDPLSACGYASVFIVVCDNC